MAAGAIAAVAIPAANSQAADQYNLVLISLQCIKTEDNSGKDDPYVLVNGVERLRTRLNNGQSSAIGATVSFTSTADIQLWEDDRGYLFDPPDLLGQEAATAAMADTGERTAVFTNHGADYRLVYKVERIGGPEPIVTVPIGGD